MASCSAGRARRRRVGPALEPDPRRPDRDRPLPRRRPPAPLCAPAVHAAHPWPVPGGLSAGSPAHRQSSRQIGLAPVLFLDRPGRGQTERAQALRIRRYLGLKSFDRKAEEDLRDWLRQGALEGRSTTELLVRVEGRLRDWRIMLPALGTLQRIVTSEVARATASLFDKVAAQLP